MAKTNRSEVDRLGDIRAEIRVLQAEEAELRDRLLATGRKTISGDDFVAQVSSHERRSLDTQAVIAWYGEKELGKFMRTSEVVTLRVKERGE